MASTEKQAHEAHHDEFLAHHFESQEQQFDAGRLGMWLFLVQEILFFSGLFCTYAIYRSHHPEIFVYADHFLDRRLGALNTMVLIFSSFTMAWAVRATQLKQKKLSFWLLGITFLCACIFLGVKFVEYEHKWHEGLLWGKRYQPHHASGHEAGASHEIAADTQKSLGSSGVATNKEQHIAHASEDGTIHAAVDPKNVHIFFGIYFVMTGLHGIHILVGMGIIAWIMYRVNRGDFNDKYFGPVEYTGLYWHLVDLVWIYLFPLLYLIH